jgi:hypothetical protein
MKTGHGIPSALLQGKKPNYEGLKKFTSDIVEGKSSAGPLPGYVASESILKNAPEQAKHLRKNVQKDPQGRVTSWDVEQDPIKITEAISVGRDSLNYVKPAKSANEAMMLGKEFSRNYSPYSKSGAIAIKNLSRGNYVGPDKSLNTDEAKAKVVNDLWSETIGARGRTDQELPKKFGIPDPNVYAKMPNPKSGAVKKKSPAKQTTSRQKSMNQPMAKSAKLGKTTADMGEGPMPSNKNPKSGENKMPPGTKVDGDLSKSGKKYGSPAKMMNKKTPAKMKKC